MVEKCGDFEINLGLSGKLGTINRNRFSYIRQVSGAAPVERDFTKEEYGDHNKVVFA
jgi:hypothetical protein